MAAGSRARGGAVERTVLAARTGTRGESAGLSLSMRCRDGARARGDRGLRVAALRGSEGRKRDAGDRARVRRGWACLDSGLRLAAAGEVGCEEAGRFGWSGLRGLAGLSLYSFINRELEERKREKKRFRGRIWACS